MKYIGGKSSDIKYKKRPGVYTILERENDTKIGIVTANGFYFFLGGGIEKGETELEALKREMLEESGYSIKDIKKFDEIGEFLYSKVHDGYFEVQAHIYTAKLGKKIKEQIEKDHSILWISPQDYIGKMATEWGNYILKEYFEKIILNK